MLNNYINAILLSNGNIFFHRFLDGNFKTKWTGLWKAHKKYLEYFAIKADNVWLTSVLKDVKYNFIKDEVQFEYFLNDSKIIEKNYLLGNSLIIEVESEKEHEFEIELAFNIREWKENYHDRTYEIKYFPNGYEIFSSKGKLKVEINRECQFKGIEFYKVHYPSFQAQKCFVPRIIKLKAKNFSLRINVEKEIRDFYDNRQFLFKIKTVFPKRFVNRLFYVSALNLRKLYYKEKNFFFAGYPWYAYLWARDSAYMVIAASEIGMFEEARNTLKNLIEKEKDGKIPNFVVEDEISYNAEDSNPLFLISLYNYIQNSGDLDFFVKYLDRIENLINYYFSRKDKRGFIYCSKNSTWMDTIGKEGYFLEVQVFWATALKYVYEIFKNLGKERKELIEASEKLKENIIKHFYINEIFVDEPESKNYNINTIFPLVFDILNSRELLEKIERDFKAKTGYSTIPISNIFFNPKSYHSGSSWGHINALIAYIQAKYKNINSSLETLRKIYEMRNVFCLQCLPEAWNSMEKDLRLIKPIGIEEGAYLQGWTAACTILAINELIGIKTNALNNEIIIEPKINGKIFKRKAIGYDIVDIKVERKNNKTFVKYRSFLGKKYNVKIIEI